MFDAQALKFETMAAAETLIRNGIESAPVEDNEPAPVEDDVPLEAEGEESTSSSSGGGGSIDWPLLLVMMLLALHWRRMSSPGTE